MSLRTFILGAFATPPALAIPKLCPATPNWAANVWGQLARVALFSEAFPMCIRIN